MKKSIALMAAALLACTAVHAADTAAYDEMKQIKKAQRERREAEKSNPSLKGESKWAKFWKNEGERSGLGQSGSGAGSILRNLNPAPFFKSQKEQYDARKAQGK